MSGSPDRYRSRPLSAENAPAHLDARGLAEHARVDAEGVGRAWSVVSRAVPRASDVEIAFPGVVATQGVRVG